MSDDDTHEEKKGRKEIFMLSETNYHAWSIRMKRHLLKKGCWSAIEGYDDTQLDQDWDPVFGKNQQPVIQIITTKERIRRQKVNDIAIGGIFDRVPDDILEGIEECISAKDVWETLAKSNTNFDFIYEIKVLKDLLTMKKT